MTYDYIIVGSGIAGLYASLHIPENRKVLIISKDRVWDCNSFYAQGGISVAKDRDDIESHIQDTLEAGAFQGDREAVSILVQDGMEVIRDLIDRGIQFDTDSNGHLLWTKEGAHSTNRILHIGGDGTGRYIHSFLLSQNRHKILDEAVVTDILVDGTYSYGVSVWRGGKVENIYSRNLILASGGVGNLFKYSTNALSISGEIHGIAVEKRLPLRDMEMLQFHPTTTILNDGRSFLISEAVRGEGAYIIDEDGERFLFQYDPRGELASRDIVSRAIFHHSKKSYLSISHFEKEWFINRFPTIANTLIQEGYQLTSEPIPISPAFHYTIGGIGTDINGLVKGYKNLYGVGEIASTGVHGANRLASNSLLEALVFSKRAVEHSLNCGIFLNTKQFPTIQKAIYKDGDEVARNELQNLMWRHVSIERNGEGLQTALSRVREMMVKDIGRVLKLQLLASAEIISSALKNRKSVGVHFRSDVE